MMDTQKQEPVVAKPFDFTKPGQVSLNNSDQWRHWLDGLTRDFGEKWVQATNTEIQFKVGEQATLRFETARLRLPKPSIAQELIVSSTPFPSILVFDRPLALSLVLQLLGEDSETLPEDRPLSEIESSICEMLFEKLIESVSESWPQKEQLEVQLRKLDLVPHRSRLWEPGKRVFVCSFEITVGESQRTLQWVLPIKELEELLTLLDEENVSSSESLKQEMEQRTYEIPVPVSVELGRTQISVTRLAALVEGDVLVFGQRITDPLPLVVDSKTKFLGWLGRCGNRQAFKISELKSVNEVGS